MYVHLPNVNLSSPQSKNQNKNYTFYSYLFMMYVFEILEVIKTSVIFPRLWFYKFLTLRS